MTTNTGTTDQAAADTAICTTMLNQIGRTNVLAISGGRVLRTGDVKVELPVRYGYSVEVAYDRGADLYNVTRWFTRNGKRWEKGHWTRVYAEDLGDTAYRASCFCD